MATDIETVKATQRRALLNDFRRFHRSAGPGKLDEADELDRLYTEDIEFRDPVHTLNGRLALRRYLRSLYDGCERIDFEYQDELLTENMASIVWDMQLRHPRLRGGQPIEVRGMTLIRFTDRIFYQEDVYDLGSMLYQHIPVLGRVIRHIKRRLAA